MSKLTPFKKLTVGSIVTGLLAVSQIVSAHTSIQTNTINEKTATYNNVAAGHGCANATTGLTSNPVIAQSVVFPDGVDSVITRSDSGSATNLLQFVTNWTSFGTKVPSKDIFSKEGLKFASNGTNRVGFYGTDGNLPGIGYTGLTPFRTASVTIDPASCANSVTFKVVVADICKITKFQDIRPDTVNIWMPSGTGSMFDSLGLDGYGSSASLKVVRTSALPPSCSGVGFDVTVTPSAAQINRDLPIRNERGTQYWPRK